MSKSKSKASKAAGPAATAQGNALIAFRCPQAVVDAFVRKHGGTAPAWAALRKHMTGAARK